MIELKYIQFKTNGKNDMINITEELRNLVLDSSISSGNILIFVPGATGALSSIEYEPGLIKDFPELMERLIPMQQQYHHNESCMK